MKTRNIAFAGALFCLAACTDSGSGTGPDPTTSTTSTPPPAAVLQVTKTAIDELENNVTRVRRGDPFLYRIELTNSGNADAVGVELRDVIPEGFEVSFIDFTERSGYDCNTRGMTLECTLSRIAPGSPFRVILEVVSESRSGDVENVVTVNPGNISASVVLEVVG